jgi:hypothetical protein
VTRIILELDELEVEHLRSASLAHYCRTMLASVEPGQTPPTEVNRQAAKGLYGKVEYAISEG